MKSLKALTTHLLRPELRLLDHDQFDAFADNIELQWRNEPQTVGGDEVTHLYDVTYDAVILIDEFTEGAARLFAEVMLWLSGQDYDFDDWGNPQVNTDPMTDEKTALEITIKFSDPCYTKPTADGGYEIVDGFELWTMSEWDGVTVTRGGCQ